MEISRKAAVAAALAAAAIPVQAGQGSAGAPAVPDVPACVTPAAAEAKAEPPPPPVLVEGLGYAGIVPDTGDAAAKAWFEQGVRLVWAYDEAEAIRAFAEAQKRDPSCAMCFWGEAWARSPTLNLQPRAEEQPAAAAAAAKAKALAGKLGKKERGLIEAMALRTRGKKGFADKKYLKAMGRLADRFPADDAIQVIAADAEMVLGARGDGMKPGTAAQRRLETVLARNPDHSGAIHLYIHLTDFIDRQALAVPHAERLGRLAPAASHLIHMPSHSFFGVGRYGDAAKVNLAALAADRAYEERVRPPKSGYRTALYAHNSHFAIQSSLMHGDAKSALEIADHYARKYDAAADKGFRAVIRAASWYAWGQHEDVDKVLAMEEPPETAPLMRAMRLYARGEALARRGDAGGVKAEAAALAKYIEGPAGRAFAGKPIEKLAGIARHVLEGRAAMLEERWADAETAFRAAMTIQTDAGFGSDPPPFWYPVRRSLAAALLAGGQPERAKAQLEASLAEWPNDPLALLALARAEEALGRKAEGAAALARARSGWAGALDAVPTARI